jgi:glycosyltransferase involved in cell wall biosynthesis
MAPGHALLRNGRLPLVCRISSYTPLLRSANGKQRGLPEYLSDWLEIRQVLDAEASFAPSALMATTFARLEAHEPQVIRTPVDLRDTSMDPSYYQNPLTGMPYLLFFGTLNRVKGADLLAQAMPSVFERHEDLALVFVGRDDGWPGCLKAFDFVSSHCQPFEHRLHYHPVLPKAQLYPFIANALGVLMPSRIDNYPNACLEAQSLGVPVVGTYGSSLDEMIVDGEIGFLAKNGDAASLGDAVERLLSLTQVGRQRMRERILTSVRSMASEDRIGQLLTLYQAAMSKL